ncbi:MAG: hypothetical protein ACOZNI_15450 [Myxococcota bacterium]
MIPSLVTLALAGPLDGKTFAVTLVDPAKKADPDTLVFASDTFESTMCKPYGFATAKYAVGKDGVVTVEATSPTEGTARWSLTVTGEHVSGTMDWVKAGQATVRYVVSGDLRK